jgi:DNA adenine methylase
MNIEECAPLIKWPGGKRRLLPQILDVAPPAFGRYYEPFFGGGAVFFALQPSRSTISDANSELIQMYLQVRDDLDSVIKSLRRMVNSEEEYYRIRSSVPRTPASQAARLIYLCTLSFNGIHRQNLNGDFNVPYGYKDHLEPCDETKLRQISQALQGRKLLVEDFERATTAAKPNDFVYFDPPYTVAHGNNGFVKYNAKIFSWDDQKRLADLARRLKNAGTHVVVSNADHSSIRELYADFQVRVIERHSIMAASNEFRRRVRECLFY